MLHTHRQFSKFLQTTGCTRLDMSAQSKQNNYIVEHVLSMVLQCRGFLGASK